ncbi:uncharacterized protein LOC126909930 [Daktulosphaira vitifoliae]|uniref:uncharacterized protein LOC126909930 n=1 Tax=Daktulosphaira vitifoliae TaxID=58002 RepID=UPI0021A98696|nr:uncharacterized protein LOC126909930 [Daktulosphaira vitifoliae]
MYRSDKPRRPTTANLLERVKWLKRAAKPKKVFRPFLPFFREQIESKAKMIEISNRLSKLPPHRLLKKKNTESKNINRQKLITPPWAIRLYQPRKVNSQTKMDIDFKPFQVRRAALRHNASDRLKELAKSQPREEKKDEVKENPTQVNPKSLKYKLTKRTQMLSKPRVRN